MSVAVLSRTVSYTALQIADLIGGTVVGDGTIALRGFAPAGAAKPGDLTFAENDIYFARALQSAASAVLPSGKLSARNPQSPLTLTVIPSTARSRNRSAPVIIAIA